MFQHLLQLLEIVKRFIFLIVLDQRLIMMQIGGSAAIGRMLHLKRHIAAILARSLPGMPAQDAPISGNFTVERLTTPEGTVVSEYIGQSGMVFAVTWRGPTPPDVATLLGTYFKQYTDAANAGAPSPFGLHASSVHTSDVTVETAGNMALTWGRAYLPAALPAGVNLSEIK